MRVLAVLLALLMASSAMASQVYEVVVDKDRHGTPIYDFGRHVYGDSTRVRAGNDSTVAISDTLNPTGFPMNFVYNFAATDSVLTAWVQFYEHDDSPSADGTDAGTVPDTMVIYRWGDKIPIELSGAAATGEIKIGGWSYARVYVTHEMKVGVTKVPLYWYCVMLKED